MELGISATPRQLMKAAKQDADVLEVLRGLVEGQCGDDPIRFLRKALESIGTECPDTAGRAAAAADTGTSTFTPIQGDRGAVLRFFNTTTGSGLDLSESETLLLYGVSPRRVAVRLRAVLRWSEQAASLVTKRSGELGVGIRAPCSRAATLSKSSRAAGETAGPKPTEMRAEPGSTLAARCSCRGPGRHAATVGPHIGWTRLLAPPGGAC